MDQFASHFHCCQSPRLRIELEVVNMIELKEALQPTYAPNSPGRKAAGPVDGQLWLPSAIQ
jgi:hypothetical protein